MTPTAHVRFVHFSICKLYLSKVLFPLTHTHTQFQLSKLKCKYKGMPRKVKRSCELSWIKLDHYAEMKVGLLLR